MLSSKWSDPTQYFHGAPKAKYFKDQKILIQLIDIFDP